MFLIVILEIEYNKEGLSSVSKSAHIIVGLNIKSSPRFTGIGVKYINYSLAIIFKFLLAK